MNDYNSKLLNGYKTEEKFILACLENNIHISRPIFNIEPYDFIIEKDNVFYTVQVKKSWVDKKGRNIVTLKTSYPRSDKVNLVSQNERVNFIAVLTEDNEWYIIPRIELGNIKSGIAVSKKGNYARYYNNFNFEF